MSEQAQIINDVTGLNPVSVWAVATPKSVEEVQDALRRSRGPVSIGGGRFSMGGQIASPGSLHLDMRRMNQVVSFAPAERRIRVQAGIRWCDIQRFVDPHGLAVKIMQSYANFTVGGALSVNCHGRYVGLGPVILSRSDREYQPRRLPAHRIRRARVGRRARCARVAGTPRSDNEGSLAEGRNRSGLPLVSEIETRKKPGSVAAYRALANALGGPVDCLAADS